MSSKITTVSQVAKQPSNKPYEDNHFLAMKAVCAQRKILALNLLRISK